jgi:hypothetical protein
MALDWPVIREVSQFALGGLGALLGVSAFVRQIVSERPRLTAIAHRSFVASQDGSVVLFARIEYEITNHSRLPNAMSLYWLEVERDGQTVKCEPAIIGSTAKGDQWFLRTRDEKATTYFPTTSPHDIPQKAVQVGPGETASFEMAFELPALSISEATSLPMTAVIGPTKGKELRLAVAPIEDLHLYRSTAAGLRPIERYKDGERVSPGQVDFESRALTHEPASDDNAR